MVFYDWIDWDDVNRVHATDHGVSVAEIDQAIRNADRSIPSRRSAGRVGFLSMTNGGRRVRVIAQIVRDNGVRPITAWEE